MKVLVETSRVLPLTTVGVTFRAGRADEPAGRDGLARVVAKMVRRKKLSAEGEGQEVEHRLDALGAELSEQVGLGSTTFGIEVLSRSLDEAVDLLAELLSEPSAAPEALGREVRQAQSALIRSRDDDGLLAGRALRRHLFDGHPHGLRVIGTRDGLGAITARDVSTFAQRHYTRANGIVHFGGDVGQEQAEALAERLAAALPAGDPVPYPAPEPEPPAGRHLVVVDKRDRMQTQLGIGTLGAHAKDEDYIPLLVANAAFGGTFTSRLTKEIRGERGWSYGASSHLTVGRVREAFTMWTAPSSDDAAACLALELRLLETWCREGITARELAQCKRYLHESYAFEIDTPSKRLLQKLERELLDLPDDFHDRYLERLADVSLQAANGAVRRRISPRNLWIACVGDAATLQVALADACGPLASSVVESVEVP